jgi:glyoxylase-like metal-dependent hydrolase (beta-lactamase superfamily II)
LRTLYFDSARRKAIYEPLTLAIPFVRNFDFAYGRCDQVSPLIRRVVAPNPGPFTFTGTGTYIVGRGQVAIIDPGPDLDEHLAALKAATDGETVTDILLTHTHGDHSPLTTRLAAETGATVRGRPAVRHAGVGVQLDESQDYGFRPDRLVDDGEWIAGPGWTLEAMATPGHAANHVAYALAEENALFCGDHVMGWSTTIVAPPDGDMDAYFDSLTRVMARDFATLWPSHGAPITEVGPFLEAYRDHRLAREAAVLHRLSEGPRSVAEIVSANYADVDVRLHPAAALSTLAHLIRLVKGGQVESDRAPGLDAVFRLATGP